MIGVREPSLLLARSWTTRVDAVTRWAEAPVPLAVRGRSVYWVCRNDAHGRSAARCICLSADPLTGISN